MARKSIRSHPGVGRITTNRVDQHIKPIVRSLSYSQAPITNVGRFGNMGPGYKNILKQRNY